MNKWNELNICDYISKIESALQSINRFQFGCKERLPDLVYDRIEVVANCVIIFHGVKNRTYDITPYCKNGKVNCRISKISASPTMVCYYINDKDALKYGIKEIWQSTGIKLS